MPRSPQRSATSMWSPPFLISTLILGVTAIALGPVTDFMHVTLTKSPIPLRAPLGRLDKSRLGPYVFVQARTLDPAVVNTLGTDQYIDWILEDTSLAGRRTPLRYAHLFVTYYTGQPDAAPHTPDQCYKGAGYTVASAENLTFHIDALETSPEVPVRLVSFIRSDIFDSDLTPVIYTFHCNGKFVASREGVRNAANNPLDKHAYYSKVELTFGWDNARPRVPSRAAAIEASQRLLEHVLPALVNDHWPDWAAVTASEAEGSDPA